MHRHSPHPFVLLCLIALLLPSLIGCAGSKPREKIRIGVYDSRSVAIAYCGSKTFNAQVNPEIEAYETAKKASDKKRMATIKKQILDRQTRLHQQGFGTKSVDDILAQAPPDLIARILKKHQITVLVSKWDKRTLRRYKHAERVDVTSDLIDLFHPNPRQRKSAMEIQTHCPFPSLFLWGLTLLERTM